MPAEDRAAAGARGEPGTGSGGSSASGGSTGSGGATGAGGTTGSGGSGGSSTGGVTGTGGSVATGGTTGSGGSPATGGATGTGGSSATGGNTGTGGTSATGGTTGTGGTGGATGTGGSTATGFCPSGALFCANFEETSGVPMNSPMGTATFEDPSEYGWTFGGTTMAAMVLDSADSPFDGKQSLKVNAPSGFAIRTLYVSVPATFWVRLYIKSDMAIGEPDHNSFFAAGTDPDYSKANNVEVSEQFNCILLNKSDGLYPTGTACGVNTALSANAWHCMAAMFDGTTGNVQVYAGSPRSSTRSVGPGEGDLQHLLLRLLRLQQHRDGLVRRRGRLHAAALLPPAGS